MFSPQYSRPYLNFSEEEQGLQIDRYSVGSQEFLQLDVDKYFASEYPKELEDKVDDFSSADIVREIESSEGDSGTFGDVMMTEASSSESEIAASELDRNQEDLDCFINLPNDHPLEKESQIPQSPTHSNCSWVSEGRNSAPSVKEDHLTVENEEEEEEKDYSESEVQEYLEDLSNDLNETVEDVTKKSPALNRSERVKNLEDGRSQCRVCDKIFSHRTSVYKHVDSEHFGIRHLCNICDQDFVSSQGLKKHTKNVHGGSQNHNDVSITKKKKKTITKERKSVSRKRKALSPKK